LNFNYIPTVFHLQLEFNNLKLRHPRCVCNNEVKDNVFDLHYPLHWWMFLGPVPVAARSKDYVCCRLPSGIAGSNPVGTWRSVSCECCVLSCRGLCFGLITRPEESYRVWFVWLWCETPILWSP